MATYFVAKTGNDSNAGTSVSAPKLTIDSAWQATTLGASDDEIIILDSETYAGSSNYELSNRNVTTFTIKGDDGTYSGSNQMPVIDGEGSAEHFMYVRGTAGTGWLIENIKFINFLVDSGVGIIRYGTTLSQTLNVNNCVFDNNVGICLGLDHDTTLNVTRCKFINHEDPDTGNYGVIIFTGGSNTNVVRIVNNLFANIGIKDNSTRLVATLNNASSRISHNTIAKRNTGVSSVGTPVYLFDIGPGTFEYNLIYNFDVGGAGAATINGTGDATVQYNTYGATDRSWSGSNGPLNGGGTSTGNLVITADPGFVNYTYNDYRLTPAARSIAIDVASGSTESVDITNTSRATLDKLAYNNGLRDNGCYETSFWSPTTQVTTNSTGEDFVIKTFSNANASFNRIKIESTSVSRDLEQVPFSVGLNGIIPTSLRQRGLANQLVTAEDKNFQPSYVNSKGGSSNDT